MTHIIYLPGFGDKYDGLRRLTLRRWESDDTQVTFIPMNWANKNETYEQKYRRVADAIQQINESRVVLIGESAGGAMALYVFSKHLDVVSQVVTICGYNHGASDVHPVHKRQRPAFYQLMPHVDRAVERFDTDARTRITTIYSTHDHVVSPSHSQLKGAKKLILHTAGHFTTIAKMLIKKTPLKLLR